MAATAPSRPFFIPIRCYSFHSELSAVRSKHRTSKENFDRVCPKIPHKCYYLSYGRIGEFSSRGSFIARPAKAELIGQSRRRRAPVSGPVNPERRRASEVSGRT